MPIFPRTWFTSRQVVAGPSPSAQKGLAVAANAPAPVSGTVGTLVSGESLRTFGGMTLAVTLLWGAADQVFGLHHAPWAGAAISAVCGAVLFWDDQTDPERLAVPRLPMRLLAAVVNTLIVYGAAASALAAGPGPK